jgi:long-chain acyl-CoA synthetase
LNRIHDKVIAGVVAAGGIKKLLFEKALAAKKAELRRGIVRNDSIWDKIVFKKVQATLGGRVRFVITGAAPIAKDILLFLRAVLGCHVLEGYGQTESSAASFITLPFDTEPGQVGPPLPNNQCKLVSVPEMNYLSENDQGEICFKGPSVFLGYWNNDEKTKEALDADGWLHSGDIGEWTSKGTLRIIDRKKNIFKLAQGEYIAPEKIENIYASHMIVAQAFVYGDSLEASLVAVIFPDEVPFKSWAAEKGVEGNIQDLCTNDVIRKLLLEEITKLGSAKGLKSFEQPKAIHVHHELMTIDNGLLTPTFKAKRADVTKRFNAEIKRMYEKLAKL